MCALIAANYWQLPDVRSDRSELFDHFIAPTAATVSGESWNELHSWVYGVCIRNLLCRRGTTSLCSAGNHVVGDRGSMFRTRMHKQSLSVVIRVQPMTITIEELQFQGRVESYIIWTVPALVIPSCVGTMWNIRMKETVTLNSDVTRYWWGQAVVTTCSSDDVMRQ